MVNYKMEEQEEAKAEQEQSSPKCFKFGDQSFPLKDGEMNVRNGPQNDA